MAVNGSPDGRSRRKRSSGSRRDRAAAGFSVRPRRSARTSTRGSRRRLALSSRSARGSRWWIRVRAPAPTGLPATDSPLVQSPRGRATRVAAGRSLRHESDRPGTPGGVIAPDGERLCEPLSRRDRNAADAIARPQRATTSSESRRLVPAHNGGGHGARSAGGRFAAAAATAHAGERSLLGAECGHEIRADRVTPLARSGQQAGLTRIGVIQ